MTEDHQISCHYEHDDVSVIDPRKGLGVTSHSELAPATHPFRSFIGLVYLTPRVALLLLFPYHSPDGTRRQRRPSPPFVSMYATQHKLVEQAHQQLPRGYWIRTWIADTFGRHSSGYEEDMVIGHMELHPSPHMEGTDLRLGRACNERFIKMKAWYIANPSKRGAGMSRRDEEYELMPHSEIARLRSEIEQFKRSQSGHGNAASGGTGGGGGGIDAESIQQLNSTLANLMEIFKETNMELKVGDHEISSRLTKLNNMSEKLDTIIDQNEKIAEAILTIADTTDMMKKHFDQEPSHESSESSGGQNQSPFSSQQAPPSFPGLGGSQGSPQGQGFGPPQGNQGPPPPQGGGGSPPPFNPNAQPTSQTQPFGGGNDSGGGSGGGSMGPPPAPPPPKKKGLFK